MDEGDEATVDDGAVGADEIAAPTRVDDGQPAEVHGPRTSVVLASCVAVAVLGVAGVLAWRGWQDRGDAVTADGAPPTTADGGAPAEREVGDLLFRRVTAEGIEVRAQLSPFGGAGGIIIDNVVGGAVALPMPAPVISHSLVGESSSAMAATSRAETGGLAMAGFAPAVPATTVVTAEPEADDPLIAPTPLTIVAGGAGVADPPPGVERPDICTQVGDLTGWAITDDAILQGNAPWTEGSIPDLYPSVMWSPDQSALAILLQVDAAVTSVRLTGPTGTFDEMTPVDGAVVLALRADERADGELGEGFSPDDIRRLFTLTAEQVGGVSMRSDWSSLDRGHPAWGGDPVCVGDVGVPEPEPIPEPAPQLPAAGPEQPDDPAAARAAIEDNFASLYGEPDETIDRMSVIDDPYGVADTMADLRDNGFGDEAESSAVVIDELVFTSGTEAAFTYTLTTSGLDFATQLGRARFIEGTWKITRTTVCQDLAKAGATCPP